MKGSLYVGIAALLTLAMPAVAQETRSEISVQGNGFFTKDSDSQGLSRTTTKTGGVTAGYRYHLNRWLAAEADYGYARNTQRYLSSLGFSRVQSDVHAATADAVVNLPFSLNRFSPYVLGGGGGLIFRPTRGVGGSVLGADTQTKGAFLYGGGADYPLSRRFSLRVEYRGFVYKDPDFGVATLKTDSWTHTAQPSAGISYKF